MCHRKLKSSLKAMHRAARMHGHARIAYRPGQLMGRLDAGWDSGSTPVLAWLQPDLGIYLFWIIILALVVG